MHLVHIRSEPLTCCRLLFSSRRADTIARSDIKSDRLQQNSAKAGETGPRAYLSYSTIVILLSYYKANPPSRQRNGGDATAQWTDQSKSEIRNCRQGYSARHSLSLTTNEKPPHSWTALPALWLQTPKPGWHASSETPLGLCGLIRLNNTS